MLTKDDDPGSGAFVAECAGRLALPVFSGEGEAEMFVWLGGAFEDGWRIRETTAGELVSILHGPLAGVGWVALDPSPQMKPDASHAGSVSRSRFVGWVLNDAGYLPQAATPRHAPTLVGPA